MTVFDSIQQLLVTVQALAPILLKLTNTLIGPQSWLYRYSYTNLSLTLTVQLLDKNGLRTRVTRRQRVRFSSREAGVISVPTWGDGKQPTTYIVAGARYLGSRSNGPNEELLLALPRAPEPQASVEIIGQRTIRGGFQKHLEYFEARVERPTKRLSVCVVFPRSRPPRRAYLVETPGRGSAPIRMTFDRLGLPRLAFSKKPPKVGTTYSLRWTW